MAKKSEKDEVILNGSRLKKITIQNFRCIGADPVSIELDRIVVLVGPNNAGKSTILKAYEYVMNHSDLEVDDLPCGVFDENNPPIIELETWLGEEKPGQEWIMLDNLNGEYVKERWTWGSNYKPTRQGWNGGWADKVPWGAANVAQAQRPKPHRVSTFSPPQVQANLVAKLLSDWIKEQSNAKTDSVLNKIRESYRDVHNELVEETRGRIAQVENAISSLVSNVFEGYKVKFEVSPNDNSDKIIESLLTNPVIRMGPENGYLANVQDQGSGTQRTLLWAALKLLAEENKVKIKKNAKGATLAENPVSDSAGGQEVKRQHVLLIDEPEICLHPSAVREACKTLYDLAEKNTNWQVMVTTHSPIFIDISRDNTTIVRVQRGGAGDVTSTTIFRPDKVCLSQEEQESLKLLNLWDPYVAEFFFGGKTILVEGDTEYSVFKALLDEHADKFPDVHIIRARGKAILLPLIKILNHFGQSYAVLHDADTPTFLNNDGKVIDNGMWTENQKIKGAANNSKSPVRLVAAIKDFETALFGKIAKTNKPYSAWRNIKNSQEYEQKSLALLEALCSHEKILPDGFIEWDTLDNLKLAVESLNPVGD